MKCATNDIHATSRASVVHLQSQQAVNGSPSPARVIKTFASTETFSPLSPRRSVQLTGELDDRPQHQAEPLYGARPAERHQVHLCRQGHQPGGEPEQRAGDSEDQQ